MRRSVARSSAVSSEPGVKDYLDLVEVKQLTWSSEERVSRMQLPKLQAASLSARHASCIKVDFPAYSPLPSQRLRFFFGVLSTVGKIHGTDPSGAKTPTVGKLASQN
jgi:hypothetical protein